MTAQEIMDLGPVEGALFFDNPASPQASVANEPEQPPMMLRAPLASDAAPPWHPSTSPDDVVYPVDTRGPGQRPYDVTDREGLDRSSEDPEGAAPPGPAPNNLLDDWQQAQPAGRIYRAPAPSLPPTVAQKWQERVGAEMTPEDLEQLRMLGVVA